MSVILIFKLSILKILICQSFLYLEIILYKKQKTSNCFEVVWMSDFLKIC